MTSTTVLSSSFRGVTIPGKMMTLRRLPSGMPVPKFATWKDGVPDLAVMNPEYFRRALTGRLCWICGNKLGRFAAFVGGPKSAASGHYTEAPCHKECAEFAAQVCPYIVTGKNMRRAVSAEVCEMLETGGDPNNPEVFGITISDDWSFDRSTMLFSLRNVVEILWWKHGRPASKDEACRAAVLGHAAVVAIAEQQGRPPSTVWSFLKDGPYPKQVSAA